MRIVEEQGNPLTRDTTIERSQRGTSADQWSLVVGDNVQSLRNSLEPKTRLSFVAEPAAGLACYRMFKAT